MPLTPALRRLCLAHPKIFLVPAECLSARGLEPDCAESLLADRRLDPAQIKGLEAGFALYWRRTHELFSAAPGSWFPPRRINLVIADDAAAAPAHFDPFGGSASLLYRSDLDTDPEYIAFLLVHNERVAMLRNLRAALICNLSYWLGSKPTSRQAFSAASRLSRRPDALLFVRLAEAFDWITLLRHADLRPPPAGSEADHLPIPEADLWVPKPLRPDLLALCDIAQAAQLSVSVPAAHPPPTSPGRAASALDTLCDWLCDTSAHLILRSDDDRTLWEPGSHDVGFLRRALAGVDETALGSLQADLRIVHERSRTFLDTLRDTAELPRHSSVLVDGDGVWLDAARQAVVYSLAQPGFDPLREASPAFHRQLLGARVMHEWGHLAHAGKLLRVPEHRLPAYRQARAALGERFLRVLHQVPARMRSQVLADLQALAPVPAERAGALARKTLSRIGDYLANRLCARLLPGEEIQAYVRANVRSHFAEGLGLIDQLARHAFEIHYLALASLPDSYFFDTTRFKDYLVHTGIVREAEVRALFDACGEVLDCYGFDETRLRMSPCSASPRQVERQSIDA